MNFIFPLILILLSVGMFLGFVNPLYRGSEPFTSSIYISSKSTEFGKKNIQSIQKSVNEYSTALNQIDQVIKTRDIEAAKRDSINAYESSLSKMLPQSVDNVNLIVEIENLAKKYSVGSLKNISIGGAKATGGATDKPVINSEEKEYNSIAIGFTITTSYSQFVSFLKDMESNLRLVDVEKLSFNTNDAGLYDFSLVIRTYWLK
ncbi:MAG: hypothetical protein WCF94_00830 [bacterium]